MILLYPGSFDPVTLGHIDIIRRAAGLSGRLIVAVLDNPHKVPLFTAEERMAFLREALRGETGIEVAAFSGLLAEYAQKRGVTAIIRGVRGTEDLTSEAQYAWHNRLFGGTETLFIPSDPALSHISGRIVREAAAHICPNIQTGFDDSVLRQLVTDNVRTALRQKFITKG
ncbi:MAG: pantetheine-phosphate adenylyltransferase [Defluviitaleaceae bacterium]|nr:pantetheine-phosphate adenylyltransferase [Defluviitaleaceae bacterium]